MKQIRITFINGDEYKESVINDIDWIVDFSKHKRKDTPIVSLFRKALDKSGLLK